ncbi:MAG: hypothetical protein WCQ77_12145 [Planctomycetota bacterium]
MAAHRDKPTHDVTHAVDLTGAFVVVAADFNHARIYAVNTTANAAPEKVTAADPSHINHNIFHHHGNPSGGFDIDKPETNEYLKTLSKALAPARQILLLGHGGGKANFSHLLETYLEKHHRDLAAKIVANVRADIDDITDVELLRLGESYFGINVPKRFLPA